MPRFVPGLADARDFLLVAGVAAMVMGASGVAAGLTPADPGPARIPAAATIVTRARPPLMARPLAQPACECDTPPQTGELLPLPVAPRATAPRASRPLHAPPLSRSLVSSSFHEWLDADPDAAAMLKRMSALARHAPRSSMVEAKE